MCQSFHKERISQTGKGFKKALIISTMTRLNARTDAPLE
jgi:hypothetical protein